MKTSVVQVDGECPAGQAEEALRQAGEIIKGGGLVAFPTETVYGLGGDALNPESARKIYAAKGRPSDNPLIIHICRFEDIRKIVKELSGKAVRTADAFWPGPLTMILHKADCVPYETTGGLDTVAVRFPSHPAARKLIEYGGGYIAAPSANASGRPSPTRAGYVTEDMDGKIEMILDGGDVGIGLESTILDLTAEPPRILRPGYITQEMLEEVLGKVEMDAGLAGDGSGQAPKAPGMKYRHYAPKGNLLVVEGPPEQVIAYINRQTARDGETGEKTGVLATSELLEQYHADVVQCVGSRGDEEEIARNLFSALRAFDDRGVTRIYSESFPDQGLGQAIMNRLLKAAGHHVVNVRKAGMDAEKEAGSMVAIGSDHGGFALKQRVIHYLEERKIPYEDLGCYSEESCDYPVFGHAVAEAVASGKCEQGIVICTTGIGISISANKVPGIRCALCGDPLSAKLTRLHNDANMLALGAGIVGGNLALEIVETFLNTPFSGEERHRRRVNLIEK